MTEEKTASHRTLCDAAFFVPVRGAGCIPLVLAWYIITELGSILENAVKMGAKVPEWLVKMLKASANMVEHAGDGSVTGLDDGDVSVIDSVQE